jgi:activator of HSP90 ATPase
MDVSFKVSKTFKNITAKEIYDAWLDSESHAEMTGGEATATDKVGGAFIAWDGYIKGKNLELEPGTRIVQAWRTTEFTRSDPDSRLEILFEDVKNGARVTILHSNLPEDGMKYRDGWKDYYFEPMSAFFATED